jgi:hypothetical protein
MKKVSDTIQDRLREIDRIDNEGNACILAHPLPAALHPDAYKSENDDGWR